MIGLINSSDNILAAFPWLIIPNAVNRKLLTYSAMFHDIYYDPKHPEDNEWQSANIAVYHGQLLGFSVEELITIKGIILATKMGVEPATEEEKLISDFDLCGLTDINTLKASSFLIRMEYSHLSNADYLRGRIDFLQKMLDSQIYYHDLFIDMGFEEKAKESIAKEISRLWTMDEVDFEVFNGTKKSE